MLSGVQQPCEVDGKRYSIVGAFTLDPLFGFPRVRLGASLQTSVEDVLRGAVRCPLRLGRQGSARRLLPPRSGALSGLRYGHSLV